MFQYTREVILNDNKNSKFDLDAYGKTGDLIIKNVGTYRKGDITQALVVKGKPFSVAELQVPAPSTTAFPVGTIGRYVVKLSLQTGEVDALLANYTTWFKRDILVEVPDGATEADVKEAFTTAFTGLEEFPVWYDVKTNTLYGKSPYVIIEIQTETFEKRNPNSPVITEGIWKRTNASVECKKKGERGFGNAYQLIKDHRLPTMENIRPWGEAIEEYPIIDTLYTMVELTQVSDRNIGGFDVLGQKATSVTKHRFWVKADNTEAVEMLTSVATKVIEE